MFYEESLWLKQVLAGLPLAPGQIVLDVGSSDLHFRTVVQPYIHAHVHKPLLDAGVRVLSADAKAQPGVDLVLDLTAPSDPVPDELRGKAAVVLCTNMLEHVVDREQVARRLVSLVDDGGTLIVTVPGRYPEHRDPIDTLYRPNPEQIRRLFVGIEPRLRSIQEAVVPIRHLRHYRPASRWRLLVPGLGWRLSAVVFVKD